jgi:hypothetical protein
VSEQSNKVITRSAAEKVFDELWNEAHGLPLPDPDLIAEDDCLIAMLRTAGVGILNNVGFQRLLITRIVETKDAHLLGNLLIRLGRTIQNFGPGLAKNPQHDKLKETYSACWDPRPQDHWPGLCSFTDAAATEWLAIVLDNKNLTQEAICKLRQRLRLEKAAKPLVGVISKDGKIIFQYCR